jgi:hypothetical protein
MATPIVEAARGVTGRVDTHLDAHVAAMVDVTAVCWGSSRSRGPPPGSSSCTTGSSVSARWNASVSRALVPTALASLGTCGAVGSRLSKSIDPTAKPAGAVQCKTWDFGARVGIDFSLRPLAKDRRSSVRPYSSSAGRRAHDGHAWHWDLLLTLGADKATAVAPSARAAPCRIARRPVASLHDDGAAPATGA